MLDKDAFRKARVQLVLLLIALAVAFGVYRMLHASDLNNSALLFIGIPAILALVVALSPPAKSTVGVVFRTITIALLLSGILFIEGTACILFAAPLFYLIGLFIALIIDWARRESDRRRNATLLLVPLFFLSFEGVTPASSFQRSESVTAARLISAKRDEVQAALAERPRFDKELPPFLRIGFPRPSRARGEGLSVGDRRSIYFPINPDDPYADGYGTTGVLEFVVTESRPGEVRFKVIEDTSVYRHWLIMEEAVVRWRSVGPNQTKVTWSLNFERTLDPAWYFAPLERYGTRLAAGYLIDTLATPSNGE